MRRSHSSICLVLLIGLTLSLTIPLTKTMSNGEVYRTQLSVQPGNHASYQFTTQVNYSEYSIEYTVLSQVCRVEDEHLCSTFNLVILPTDEYQKYLDEEEYTSSWSHDDCRNNVNLGGIGGGSPDFILFPKGKYVFMVEYISGSESLVLGITIVLGTSDEEVNALRNQLPPYYVFSLPPLISFVVCTGGVLMCIVLSKKSREQTPSKNKLNNSQ